MRVIRMSPLRLIPLPGPLVPPPDGGIVPPWLRDPITLPVEPERK